MSEFLSNLAARSMGTLEVMRPRVPSRFEPLRNSEGLLAKRTPLKDGGLEGNLEMEREADAAGSAPGAEVEQRPMRPPDAPARTLKSDPSPGEPVPQMGSNPPMAPAEPVLRAQRIAANDAATPAPAGRTRRTVRDTVERDAQKTEGFSPESNEARTPQREKAEFTRSGDKNKAESGGKMTTVEPASSFEASSSPSALGSLPAKRTQNSTSTGRVSERTKPADSSAFRARGESLSSSALSPGLERFSQAHTAQSQLQPTTSMQVEPHPGWSNSLEDRGHESRIGAASAQDSAVRANPLDGMQDLSVPRMTRQDATTIAADAGRPAGPMRLAISNPPTLPAPGNSAEPAIRVTIGRVDVRAVFPEQPVKRSAPPRFKPTVSLDDYLNRGSGAKR
jgi:hypothetical protein